MQGKLYLCATPIGNLEDITMRAVRVLREVDLIAAEDTRNSIKLLRYYDIGTPMTSYHEHNKIEKGRQLVDKMLGGMDIALITDAGMPAISDPGEDLVRMCREEGIEVSILPGACACVSALALSGLPSRRFAFEAFLPREKKERTAILDSLRQETRTIVLYEAPHRLRRTLGELLDALGDREIVLCRELTKKYESVLPFTLAEAASYYEDHEPKGEFVIVVKGKDADEIAGEARQAFKDVPLPKHMAYYEGMGMTRKEAMKRVAQDRGVSKREIYALLLEEG